MGVAVTDTTQTQPVAYSVQGPTGRAEPGILMAIASATMSLSGPMIAAVAATKCCLAPGTAKQAGDAIIAWIARSLMQVRCHGPQ